VADADGRNPDPAFPWSTLQPITGYPSLRCPVESLRSTAGLAWPDHVLVIMLHNIVMSAAFLSGSIDELSLTCF